ncbi:endolytic transglycosylase MltG [Microbacterium luticocti]|uniref:endolytic transglycosylase MltG n=1 Tax=Microbacterium luticocti TaxID=451764 RepID=UPI00040C7FF3|nr:endolytic transglycosylase MltG [Microbacterium luticocti]
MPEARPDGDDPFADLYGRLPDPRSGQTGAHAADAADGAVPTSRRAAREAARRAAAAGGASRDGAAGDTPATGGRDAARQQPTPVSAPRPTDAGAPASAAGGAAQAASAHRHTPSRPTATDQAAADQHAAHGQGAHGHTSAGTAHRPSVEDLFTGAATTDALGTVPPGKSRRAKRRGRWIALAVVLVVLGGIAGGGYYVWHTYEPQIRSLMGWEEPKDYEAGQAHGEALVTIVAGDTGASISKSLASAGVTKTPGVFYDMLVSSHANPTFYPGVYKLQKMMTAKDALTALTDPANKLENSALLPEGLTEDQILKRLSDALKIPLADFQAAVKDPSAYGVKAKSLEGWLFPAMYTFPPGVTAKDVIKTMVDRTVSSLDDAGVAQADRERILTIASIIQREARSSDDFYKVSRVIENRLDPNNQETFGKLQMDSTAQYGYGEMHDGTASSSAAALKDDNPWNTYVHAGLPVGPISNPGDVAIDAAMHPAAGPWLYFVTVNLDTGKTVFSTTYAEHEKAVTQFQQWCKAHPDSGC